MDKQPVSTSTFSKARLPFRKSYDYHVPARGGESTPEKKSLSRQLFSNYAKTLRSSHQPLFPTRAINAGPDAGFLSRPRSVVVNGCRYAAGAALSLSVKVGFDPRISLQKLTVGRRSCPLLNRALFRCHQAGLSGLSSLRRCVNRLLRTCKRSPPSPRPTTCAVAWHRYPFYRMVSMKPRCQGGWLPLRCLRFRTGQLDTRPVATYNTAHTNRLPL